MNRAAAWSASGVGREARDVAQEAARRAGMSLGEWLDQVIAEQAAGQGVNPQDFDQDERLDAIGDRLSGLPRHDDCGAGKGLRDSDSEGEKLRPRAPSPAPAAPGDSSRAEELLDAAIDKFESRAAKSEARTARAFDSVATWIESSQKRRRDEHQTLQAVVGRLASLEERIAGQQAALAAAANGPAARAEPAADSTRDLDERLEELTRRIEASDQGRHAAVRAIRPRFDINEAVTQIARRRQELDARTANGEPETARRGWRNFGIEAPALARSTEQAPPAENAASETAPRESAASAPQIELGKLSQRFDELRRLQSERRQAPPANIDGLRVELAAMSRSLADLAPKNAVVALEGAIRDLSQRVAVCRENGARDNLLSPVEGLVAELRESLRAHDPRQAVETLQREITAIGAKVDSIARASVNPLAFERIRQQTEEARNLLAALAQRPVPLDRLERQIGDLADRVDRLPMSLAPHAESAQLVASLAEARAQVERSTPASALTSIERRLEEIASKMDQALERPPPGPTASPSALEELSRRIDGVRESIETRYASAPGARLDTTALEQAMREISAKLDRPSAASIDPAAFETMIHDLGARIDRRANPVIDTGPLEQVLRRLGERPVTIDTRPLEGLIREISAKLDGAQAAAPNAELLESLLRDISAKLDRPPPPAVDPAAFESMIRDLGARIDRRANPIIETQSLEHTLRALHDKIEMSASPQFAAERIDQAVQILSERIASATTAAPDVGAVEELIRRLEQKFENTRVGGCDPHALDTLADEIADVKQRLDAAQTESSSIDALERMVSQLLAELDRTRQASPAVSATSSDAAGGEGSVARGLAQLRAEQSDADRRIQATLGGVHHMLESLVDRMGQIEDDIARAERTPYDSASLGPSASANQSSVGPAPASAALNWRDATIREAPVLAPARPAPGLQADGGFDALARRSAPATPMRSTDGSDFLIEPGAGAPLRARDKDPIAGADPKSAVNAHIAAARRAAQAALAETANSAAKPSPAEPAALAGASGIEQAKAFFAARRRPILLGATLVALLVIAAVELGVMRQPNAQKSEAEPIAAPKLASAEPSKEADAPPLAKSDARAIDATPVGSIAATPSGGPVTKFLAPAPADLVAAIPAAAPQGLREAAAAGDPAAQFELGSRLADGRNMPRDPHAAAQWFGRAAAQGLAPAQYRLGSLYEKGVGVSRDAALARAWYKKAADAGNARAMHNLAVLIAEGAGVKPDYSEAADWFGKAARLGMKDSQYNLAILHARGMGLAQDFGQSWFWFSLAAQQGDSDAARKRDEVAAKMDAKALAADAAALADFRPTQPSPAANEVPAPPGGWDFAKMTSPQQTQAQPTPPQASGSPLQPSHSAPM